MKPLEHDTPESELRTPNFREAVEPGNHREGTADSSGNDIHISESRAHCSHSTCFEEKSPSGLLIAKYMDVAIEHIHISDVDLQESECVSSSPVAIVYFKDSYGYFVHICHDMEREDEQLFIDAGFSEDFMTILREALAAGAAWICFDVDGSLSENLPTFEHEQA